jgi:xanthine dehydrogenase accessory factor
MTMMPMDVTTMDVLDLVADKKARCEAFALATVVRAVSVTSAKAGAKAVIAGDGTITGGWIGGGCARAAVLKAAREALQDGHSRLVSIQPPDLLTAQGFAAGEERDGITFAKNMCPSQGTMDVFVEPILPRPSLLIFGASPVATALASLAGRMGFSVIAAASRDDLAKFDAADVVSEGLKAPAALPGALYVVVSTQGSGDRAALTAAAQIGEPHYVAFVGSRRKAEALRKDLAEDGVEGSRLEAIKAPAGLDIGAITSDEIALSIMAEIVDIRRRGKRTGVAEAQNIALTGER